MEYYKKTFFFCIIFITGFCLFLPTHIFAYEGCFTNTPSLSFVNNNNIKISGSFYGSMVSDQCEPPARGGEPDIEKSYNPVNSFSYSFDGSGNWSTSRFVFSSVVNVPEWWQYNAGIDHECDSSTVGQNYRYNFNTNNIDISSLTKGQEHRLNLKVCVGSSNCCYRNIFFFVPAADTTAPTCSIHYPCNSSYESCSDTTIWTNSNTGYIKLNESDNTGGSGIDTGSGNVDRNISTNKGTSWNGWADIQTTIDNFSTTLTNCYYYRFRYQVKDIAGNTSTWSDPGWQLRVDTTNPSAAISYDTHNDANPSTSTSIPITLTESDVCSGVASGKVQYKVKDLGASTWPSSWTDLKNTTTDWNYTGLVGKCYKFQYQTTDNAGNTSAWDNPNNMFCINTTPPTVNIKARPSGSGTYSDGPININYNTKADLRWTVTDATSCTASGDWSGSKTASGTTTETTANLTANKTYTITCSNGVGGTDSDSVTVNVGDPTLSIVFSANKTSGSAPLTGAIFTTTVSGSAIGTINYTFYCNRSDSGTNITLPASFKIDGTNDNPLILTGTCDSIYSTPGTYYAKVIAERDTATPVQAKITITVTNSSPTAANLSANSSSQCVTAPYYSFAWTYSDSDDDDESQFLFQIDDNSNYSSPVIDRTISVDYPSPSSNNQVATLSTTPTSGYLEFDTRYYWRVKVTDEHGASSNWTSGSSFTTPDHHYPIVNFTNTPTRPNVNEDVQFTDTSTCYDDISTGSPCTKPNDSYRWTFTNGTPSSSLLETPLPVVFTTVGNKSITLQITDSDSLTCSKTRTINVNYPPPTWKEVLPE